MYQVYIQLFGKIIGITIALTAGATGSQSCKQTEHKTLNLETLNSEASPTDLLAGV